MTEPTQHQTSFCPLCWGLGEAFREDRRGRLFCWPCPNGCPQGRTAGVVRTPRSKGMAKKAGKR